MLKTYFKPVLSKHRGVALGVWGEAGIGKSYRVKSLLQALPCQKLSLHATTSLESFVIKLKRPKKLALWAEKTLEKVQKGESVENSNVINALATTLAGLAPFVLHLEDIHEVGTERLEFIQTLAQTVKKLRGVGLLVTSRQVLNEPFLAVKLEALSQEDSEVLLEDELKAVLPKEALEFIYNKAAGNPLFTLEYVRFLARAGHLWNDGKIWHWRKPEQERMPVVVEALIEQMLEQVKTVDMQRYVLETKALLPLEASLELWEKVARVTSQELSETIQDLSRQGIFKENHFAHPLFREVARNTLAKDRRQHLARRAINALQDNPVQAALFVDDAKLEDDKALELLMQAANHLEKNSQKAEAFWSLEKALNYVTNDKKGELALKAAQLASKLGDSRALKLAQIAATHLDDVTEAQKIIALSYAVRGDYDEMKIALKQIGHQIDSNYWIQCLFTASAYGEIISLIETGIDPETLDENSIYFIAWAYIDKGNLVTAQELAEEWLKQNQLSTGAKANLLDIRASVLHYQGKYIEADPIFSEVIKLYQVNGASWDGAANALRNRAINRMQMDLYCEVIPDFLESLEIYAERGVSIFYAQTLVMLSDVYFELGDYEKMETVLIESLSIFEGAKPQHFHINALSNLAYLYTNHQHNALLASKYAHKALEIAHQLKSTFYEIIAQIAVASVNTLSQPTRALESINNALTLAQEAGIKELSLKAQFAKAQILLALKQETEARDLFQNALQEATQAGTMLTVHNIALELARLNNDITSAREHMQWFLECGLMNGVNIAKRYFPELADKPQDAVVIENTPQVLVLGDLQISHQGKIEKLKGTKRQEFMALLIEAKLSGRSDVTRLELFDTLYPNEDELKAANNLKDMVYSLRETFAETAIVTTANGYALGNMDSDAEQFLKTGDTGLWRSVYLEGLGVGQQEMVSESLYLTLFEKARNLLETDPKEVARVGRVLLKHDPYNRDYLTLCLQALRASNNHKSLTRLYAEAKDRFLELGETLPETWQSLLESVNQTLQR